MRTIHRTFAAAVALLAAILTSSCASPDAITYQDVAGLPRQERLKIFSLASPEEMAAIYRVHIGHIADLPAVTSEERALLATVGALVTPAWYTGDESAQEEAEQIMRGLSRETMLAIVQLGGEGP